MAKVTKKETVKISEKNLDEDLKKIENEDIKKSNVVVEPIGSNENTELLETQKQLAEMKKIAEEQEKQMETIKQMLSLATTSRTVEKYMDDEEIVLGCNMVYGVSLESSNKEARIELKYRTENSITEGDFRKIIRENNVKELFRDGIVYFIDENNYTKFRILNPKDISDDIIYDIMNEQYLNDIVIRLNKLTDNKQNHKVLHSILYRICDMMRKKEIKDLSYEMRMGLESYFNFNFDRGIEILKSLDSTK